MEQKYEKRLNLKEKNDAIFAFMGIKAALSIPFAKMISGKISRWQGKALTMQDHMLKDLIRHASKTVFGKDHHFSKIKSYADFKNAVPLRDYEGLRPYIDRILQGKKNILWKGKPVYLAKTSGTTSGIKYIPISKASLPAHIRAARNALLLYIAETGNTDFIKGNMIFLQGSPELEELHGMKVGRLSGIVAHHVPGYLQGNRLPSYATNCIEDWEEKVEAIITETLNRNMTLISGIPPWVQMYFDRIQERTGKKIKDVFPGFKLFVYGGVNFEPYRNRLEESIGRKTDSIETYPASEGFIAFQDSQKEEGLLLNLDAGIFYEFVPVEDYFSEHPQRLSLREVEVGKNYALILNTNAGLWGYSIGDTIKFVSLKPHRIIVTGRIKHFISAFGEHVIAEEIESALKMATEAEPAEITEFTVAPQVNASEGELPYHEWFIEFSKAPADAENFRLQLDRFLQEKNTYYKDLIEGKVLQTLKIRNMQRDTFIRYMKAKGKLGGQNKLPRLGNDRQIADDLQDFIIFQD